MAAIAHQLQLFLESLRHNNTQVAGVVNLAPDAVPASPEALPAHLRHFYVDVRHTDGMSLTDKAGDGKRCEK